MKRKTGTTIRLHPHQPKGSLIYAAPITTTPGTFGPFPFLTVFTTSTNPPTLLPVCSFGAN